MAYDNVEGMAKVFRSGLSTTELRRLKRVAGTGAWILCGKDAWRWTDGQGGT